MSAMGILLILVAALAIWGLSGFFRVQSEELGVVLRFGKHVRTVQPGLNYHLPYPIETVLLPKALRVSTISIGTATVVDSARRARSSRSVPEESLMLTGDENIVDVDFAVLWRIKPNGVGDFLFNIQNPEGTVKAVAESAMRDVIGRTRPDGVVCLAGVSSGGHKLSFDVGDLNRTMVLENHAVFGSVNANRRHYQAAADALAKADKDWLSGLISRRVPLSNWRDAFAQRNDDIKVVLTFE